MRLRAPLSHGRSMGAIMLSREMHQTSLLRMMELETEMLFGDP